MSFYKSKLLSISQYYSNYNCTFTQKLQLFKIHSIFFPSISILISSSSNLKGLKRKLIVSPSRTRTPENTHLNLSLIPMPQVKCFTFLQIKLAINHFLTVQWDKILFIKFDAQVVNHTRIIKDPS